MLLLGSCSAILQVNSSLTLTSFIAQGGGNGGGWRGWAVWGEIGEVRKKKYK